VPGTPLSLKPAAAAASDAATAAAAAVVQKLLAFEGPHAADLALAMRLSRAAANAHSEVPSERREVLVPIAS